MLNLNRIVSGQLEDAPQIYYDQDSWVTVQ